MEIVVKDGLRLVDLNNPSDDVIVAAIKENVDAFTYINKDKLTERLVEKLLHVQKTIIVLLPDMYVTRSRLLRAVRSNVTVLERFTDYHYEFVTAKDLLNITVKAYNYLKPELIDDELCMYGASRYPDLYCNLPEKIKTKEFNRKIVQRIPKLIGLIPELHINRKLVQIAYRRDPSIYHLIPLKYQNDYAEDI